MLRIVFVAMVMIAGIVGSFYGTFNTLLFYLWLAYFRPEYWLWDPILLGWRISLFAGVLLLISTLVTGKKFIFSPFTLFLSAMVLVTFASTMLSDYSDEIMSDWVDFLKILLVSYLITIIVTSQKELKILFIVIAISLGSEASKQGWGGIILHPGSSNTNAIPFLGDNNMVAVGMCLLAPIMLAVAQTFSSKLIRYGGYILAIGVFYRGVATYSRGGMLSFACLLIIFWLKSKHKAVTLIVIVVIAALLLPLFPQSFWDRMETITAGKNEITGSASSRLHFWSVGYDMAVANPFLGVGFDAYSLAYNKYDYSLGEFGRSRAVHSTWFGLMAELGFTGLILFLIIYFYAIYCCERARRNCKNIPDLQMVQSFATAIEIGLVAALVGITFLHFQYCEMLWHFFALASVTERFSTIHIQAEQQKLTYDDYAPVTPGWLK